MTDILDGRKLAGGIRETVLSRSEMLRAEGLAPCLAVVVATADQATASYVRAIARSGQRVGVDVRVAELDAGATESEVAGALAELAADERVHGIILQTPLPPQVPGDKLVELIPPDKDVDGANPLSAGRLALNVPAYAPATAAAVLEVLTGYGIPIGGQHAVVVGRSAVVGKPAALLLLGQNATVTICHSRTRDLAGMTREADILVAAIGRPAFFGASHVQPGATVIDVGTNVDADGNLVGDVDSRAVADIAGAITPVPGGVGPITTAILLRNTVQAAAQASEITGRR